MGLQFRPRASTDLQFGLALSHHLTRTTSFRKDTEFPGNFVSKQSIAHKYSEEEIDYQVIWHNIEQTKLIQIGITLAAPSSMLPFPSTWQFHLAFDINKENSVPESIALLQEAGIPFDKLLEYGIPPSRFA